MTVWMSEEDWLHFGFIFQVMSLHLDFSPMSPDYYSSKGSSWNKIMSPKTWDSDLWVLLDPATAFQEVAEGIKLPHTSPQNYQLVVLAERNECPSGTHFKPLHCWFLSFTELGEEGEDRLTFACTDYRGRRTWQDDGVSHI